MLKLWLVRHGEAADPDASTSDFHRVLTTRGRRRLSEMMRWLLQREQAPELILHSPLVRAQQSAETIGGEFGARDIKIRVENRLAPGVNPGELLKSVSHTTAEVVLCVGHQPDMSRCLAEMVAGGHVGFFPGTIARIDFEGPIIQGAGCLRWVTDPHWFD